MEEAAIAANSENEVLKCVGSKHSLVLFWTRSNYRGGYYERAMEPNRYLIIGCDDDARKNLLRYRSHFLGHTFRWSCSDCHGVIERVLKNNSPEMSPNISFYSEDEYPHLHFALSCGILSSFCFPFYGSNRRCVMEIVSTSNQDVETLMKFCQSIKGFHWFWSFRDIKFHKYTQPVPEIDHLLEVVSQTFQLPLAQYWNSGRWIPCLEMDNDYPQTLLNSIWATINKCLPNWYLSSGEQPGQVLSVKIINSSAQIEPESFKLGQNNSSLSHLEVLEYTHTSNLFENNSGKRTNLFSHEEAAAERTSNKVPTKAFQPRTSEEHRTTLAAERVDNPVEVSTDEDVEYAVTTESERYKKSIIPFTEENISKHFGKPLKDAAEIFGVSRSTFKRICRGLGIERWRYGKRRLKSHSSSKLNRVNDEGLSIQNFSHLSMAPLQVRTASQTSQEINVKATYNKVAIRFELLDSSGMAELEDNLIERLKLERDAFSIKYKDEEGDWVLIACDKDVQKCIEITRSLGKTIITMLVDPPISHYGS